ncbi:MAG: hypothetical protein ACUZ8E_10760 [Candidatus Anammoxibacter sp.]
MLDKKMEQINTVKHMPELKKIAQSYRFPLENIETVLSIQKWCEGKGIDENNPFLTGKCLKNSETGKYKILLAAEITAEMQNSVIGAMSLRGYGEEINLLNEPSLFITHLLLHEIAHAINEKWSESECDSWAFKELEKFQSNSTY